jgi:hypothetical protein
MNDEKPEMTEAEGLALDAEADAVRAQAEGELEAERDATGIPVAPGFTEGGHVEGGGTMTVHPATERIEPVGGAGTLDPAIDDDANVPDEGKKDPDAESDRVMAAKRKSDGVPSRRKGGKKPTRKLMTKTRKAVSKKSNRKVKAEKATRARNRRR